MIILREIVSNQTPCPFTNTAIINNPRMNPFLTKSTIQLKFCKHVIMAISSKILELPWQLSIRSSPLQVSFSIVQVSLLKSKIAQNSQRVKIQLALIAFQFYLEYVAAPYIKRKFKHFSLAELPLPSLSTHNTVRYKFANVYRLQ